MFDDDLVWATITHGEKTSALFYLPLVSSSTQIFRAMGAIALTNRMNVIDWTLGFKYNGEGVVCLRQRTLAEKEGSTCRTKLSLVAKRTWLILSRHPEV